jgi:NADH:ubiquinone oxidoreductase subunit K
MKSRASARLLIVKEVRALLPAWMAGLVAIGAAFVSSDGRVLLLAAIGYAVAAVALGVQTIGHEYTNRTRPAR